MTGSGALLLALLALAPTRGETLATVSDVAPAAKKAHLIMAPRDSAEAVLRIQFPVGSFDDAFEHGLTRLSQRALVEASAVTRHADWARDLFAAAATLDLETGVRGSAFVLRAPKKHFHALANKLIKMVFAPRLDSKAFARAKTRTLTDQMRPGSGADLNYFLARSVVLLGGGKPGEEYTNPPHGEKDNLLALKQKRVEQHLARHFTPGNATLIVTGAFSEQKIKKALKKKTGGSRNDVARPAVEKYLPVEQTHFHLRQMHLRAFPVELDTPEKVAAARLLEKLLQWRIMWKFRTQGWLYSPMVYADARPWMDFLVVLLPVYSKDNLNADGHLDTELAGIADGQLDDGDFEKAKGALLAHLQRIDESPLELARALGRAPGRVPWHAESTLKAVANMDAVTFKKIALPWMKKERLIKLRFGQNR
jgi:predicted Zn-dependent peptidase